MPSGDNNKGKKLVVITINSRPIEEARKIQSMGGIASRVAKRRKKLIKEELSRHFLNCQLRTNALGTDRNASD